MKDIITDTTPMSDNDRPEPFASLLELASDYGKPAILAAVMDLAEFDSEDEEDLCAACRLENEWLRLELEQLLDRYELLFPELEVAVNHEGPLLVQ
jgi:hypothetical protein